MADLTVEKDRRYADMEIFMNGILNLIDIPPLSLSRGTNNKSIIKTKFCVFKPEEAAE